MTETEMGEDDMNALPTTGPLSGLRVIELQGRGPGPFGAMVLADLGADVIRITRPNEAPAADALETGSATERLLRNDRRADLLGRGRRAVGIDLKHPDGIDAALDLIDVADVVVEGFRPGAVERLGLGPDVCRERNPGLVYVRITGWGQSGPYAHTPGHDINYVALTGLLDLLPKSDGRPQPPLNFLGDWGGGGMLLVVGVLAALFERSRSGVGQVVDAAMIDGASLLSTFFHGAIADGLWSDDPGQNVLSLGAPFYNVYETADGKHITVGAGEPQFYARLIELLGADPALLERQSDAESWAQDTETLTAIFLTRTRDEWCELLDGTDTCFAPVLTLAEAHRHPHHAARQTFVEVDGVVQPSAAPRFDRTPATTRSHRIEADPGDTLVDWGLDRERVDALRENGAVT